MCYNWQSSIVSFFVGTTCSLYLLQQKDKYVKHAGAFFIIISLMQLIEFFIWIDQDCGWFKRFGKSVNNNNFEFTSINSIFWWIIF